MATIFEDGKVEVDSRDSRNSKIGLWLGVVSQFLHAQISIYLSTYTPKTIFQFFNFPCLVLSS